MIIRFSLWLILTGLPAAIYGQAFMRPMDNAATLALGGAVVAYPGLATGLTNDAAPGLGNKAGLFFSSAIPFGIGGWNTARFQGFMRIGANDGLGLDLVHSAIEAYGEQQFRLLYGRRLGEKVLLGGSAQVLRLSAKEYGNATAATFSLSALANPLPALWFGAKVQNPLQLEMSGAVIPAVLRIGAAWQAAPTLTVLAEVDKDLDRRSQIKGGIEYLPIDKLVLRIGLRTTPARMGFGAGLRFKNGLELDTSAEWHPTLGITPSAMVVWRRE